MRKCQLVAKTSNARSTTPSDGRKNKKKERGNRERQTQKTKQNLHQMTYHGEQPWLKIPQARSSGDKLAMLRIMFLLNKRGKR